MSNFHRILVVDDEPDLEPLVLQRMRREIRKGRYGFVFAHNGIEALECLKADKNIDIVLSDINMPKMDGLTLLQEIPKVNSTVKSVVVSAYGDMKNIRKAMNCGAFDFITKPIDFNDLRITIERTVRHLEMWKEAQNAQVRLSLIDNELGIASRMQQSILPRKFPGGRNFELFGKMEPAREVGGDFFDVVHLENGLLGLAVADVSDKGVPAALFMMSSRTILKGAAIGIRTPCGVLKEVNDMLVEDNEAGMFVTMFYCVFDPITGTVQYSNGGHNYPLLVHSDGSAEFLETKGGIALGMVNSIEFNDCEMRLAPGDSLIMYTDGVTEAVNSKDEFFGDDRLISAASRAAASGIRDISAELVKAVHVFSEGVPQTDDITCLMIKYDRHFH